MCDRCHSAKSRIEQRVWNAVARGRNAHQALTLAVEGVILDTIKAAHRRCLAVVGPSGPCNLTSAAVYGECPIDLDDLLLEVGADDPLSWSKLGPICFRVQEVTRPELYAAACSTHLAEKTPILGLDIGDVRSAITRDWQRTSMVAERATRNMRDRSRKNCRLGALSIDVRAVLNTLVDRDEVEQGPPVGATNPGRNLRWRLTTACGIDAAP